MKTYYDEKINDYVNHVSDIIKAVAVKPLTDYRLLVEFSTGECKIFDVKPLLEKPHFAPIKNIAIFNAAHIECNTVVWNDEIDLCPESLYNEGVKEG